MSNKEEIQYKFHRPLPITFDFASTEKKAVRHAYSK